MTWGAVVVAAVVGCSSADQGYTLAQLEGAWWSDDGRPTAAFAVSGSEVWLDVDAQYHPAHIVGGDTLVYDLGPDLGELRRRIVSLVADTLVLETVRGTDTVRTVYRRAP